MLTGGSLAPLASPHILFVFLASEILCPKKEVIQGIIPWPLLTCAHTHVHTHTQNTKLPRGGVRPGEEGHGGAKGGE